MEVKGGVDVAVGELKVNLRSPSTVVDPRRLVSSSPKTPCSSPHPGQHGRAPRLLRVQTTCAYNPVTRVSRLPSL